MNLDQLLSLVRTLLKIIGGILAAHGLSAEAGLLNSADVIGAVLLIVSVLWSHFAHKDNSAVPVKINSPLLTVACLAGALSFGCASHLLNSAFRAEQTAVNLAYGAYQGWTNYLVIQPPTAALLAASNEVKQARLKFAATLSTAEQLRAEAETNSAARPLLQNTLTTLSDQSSNVVWLINFYRAK